MTKKDKMILVIVSAGLALAVLSWLTSRVLPDIWIVHLVPLEEKVVHPLPQYGPAIIEFNNSKIVGHRVIESTKVGWDGILPVAILGIIIGTISGSLFGYLLGYDNGYEKGTPDREFIENALKAFEHARELASKVEEKEQYVEQRMEKAENLWSRSSQQCENASKVLREYDRKMKEADKLLAGAEKKSREAEAKASEISKAQAKIRRLEGRIARDDKKKQKSIDEIGEED